MIVFLLPLCYNKDNFMEGAGTQVMEDTKKQDSQELISTPAEEPDLHLIDFWEMLSELRI